MNPSPPPVSVNDNDFVMFMSRITGLWLIALFIVLWLMGQMPYQLSAGKEAWINTPFMNQLVTILPSTLAMLFMIIPSRGLALICLLSMLVLLISYHGRTPALMLPAFPLIFIPFLMDYRLFRNAWKWNAWLILLSFLITVPVLSVSYKAIPGYTLLLHAFIPWERLFVRFVHRFEPK